MEWIKGNKIKVDIPKRPKKITGTRFAAIMGLNKWNTPFKTWCEITRTYEEPFEDTIYTIAGKTIEPKQAEYMKQSYYMPNLITPTDIFGDNYFKVTRGDFFHDEPIFGGMWDYLNYDEDGKLESVLEMKTTKRSEDWADDIPEYYALQAALYAYLLGVDQVIMVASFLEDKDYKHPEAFVPSATNTIVVPFKISERYPDFEDYIRVAEGWWRNHVLSGISPEYDETADADILKELRTNTLSPETDIDALIKEGEALKEQIDKLSEPLTPLIKRLKTISDIVKEYGQGQFREGDKKVSLKGSQYSWDISKTTSTKINKNDLAADGLLDKYSTAETSYRLTTTRI